MGIKKYFKKEINKQRFICIKPLIAIILLLICQITYYSEEYLTFWLTIYGILLLTTVFLSIVYIYTYSKYKKLILIFSKEELERINSEARTVYNMGKWLITNDVIIFFGFFSKKVIPIKTIRRVYKEEGTDTSSRDWPTDYHNIILKLKNDKKICIPAPKNYTNTECANCQKIIEKIVTNNKLNEDKFINVNLLEEASVFKNYKETRFLSRIDITVGILYFIFCLVINKVIDTNINNSSDLVLKTFYNVGIEGLLYDIELIIYTVFFIILNIYYRYFYKNSVKGNTLVRYWRAPIFLALISFNYIFIVTSTYDYQKEIRSDYISSLKGEYKTYTGKISHNEGFKYYNLSWISYYKGEATYLYSDDIMFVYRKKSVDESKVYKIKYLPKTHLILDIAEEKIK